MVGRFTYRGARTRALAGGAAVLALAGIGVAAPASAASAGHRHPADCPPSTYAPPHGPGVASADLDGSGSRQPLGLELRTDEAGELWELVGVVGTDHRPVGTEVRPLDQADSFRLYGIADVDGDGDDDVLLAEGAGAYSEAVQVWGVRDCRWTQLTRGPENEPIRFLVHGGVINPTGMRCSYGSHRSMMYVWSAAQIPESDRYELTVTSYAMTDLHLMPLGPEATVEVTGGELQGEWLPPQSCNRRVSEGTPFPAPSTGGTDTDGAAPTTTTTSPTTKPATTPTPVRATPSYTG